MRATFPLPSFIRLPRPLARYAACTRGVTAIEFAFVAPMLIAILLMGFQISMLYVAQAYLEAVTEKAMRLVLTNQTYTLTAAQFQTQLCANVTAMFNCNNMIIDLQSINDCSGTGTALTTCFNKYQPQFDSTGKATSTPVFNSGASGDKMRLLVMYQWPVLTGPLFNTSSGTSIFANFSNGTRLLSAVQIFYKEPCLDLSNCVAING